MEITKNILVTGGAGYIGSHTVVELSKAGYHCIVLDDFRASQKSIKSRIDALCDIQPSFYNVDCTDSKTVKRIFAKYPIDGVIHFAAYKSVEESIAYPKQYFHNNIGSLQVILDLMQEYDVKPIVFSSSCTVYGQPDRVKVKETDPHKIAESPYGYTKQICENLLQYEAESGQSMIKSCILRYFNPVGAHPSGMIGESPLNKPTNLVPIVCRSASNEDSAIKVFGTDYPTADGSCLRDFIHVVDLANAHIHALEYMMKTDKALEIFNVGTGKANSVLELLEGFQEVNDVKLIIEYTDRRKGDIVEICADTEKINEILQWYPQYTLKDALKHAWQWQLNQSQQAVSI